MSPSKDIFDHILKYLPRLRKDLLMAQMLVNPKEFLKSAISRAMIMAFAFTVLSLFMILKNGTTIFFLLPLFISFFAVFLWFNFVQVRARIIRRKNAIDREVVFAARYMLLRLHSGQPLLNALIDQSKSYGVAAEYVKEIVDDVNSGTTLEASLEEAMEYTPSEKFRKILFHIRNALKYGSDVSRPLEAAIHEITQSEVIEIEKYGKKMNSLIVFYMLLGIVVPSLGITVFITIAGLINIPLSLTILLTINFFVLLLQLLFLTLVQTIRPSFDL